MGFQGTFNASTARAVSPRTAYQYDRLAAAIADSDAPRRAYGGRAVATTIDPYPTWSELLDAARVARNGGARFKVYDGDHGHPLWTDRENWLFREHHDAIHVIAGEPIHSLSGETHVWGATCTDLKIDPLSELGLILYGEIVGQARMFETTGSFPLAADGSQPAITRPGVLYYPARRDLKRIQRGTL